MVDIGGGELILLEQREEKKHVRRKKCPGPGGSRRASARVNGRTAFWNLFIICPQPWRRRS